MICNYCGKDLEKHPHSWQQCSIQQTNIDWDGAFKEPADVTPSDRGVFEDTLHNWAEWKLDWKKKNPGEKGMKFSQGKPKWQLMGPLWPQMEQVVQVLTRGAEKYEPNNWMDVDRDEYLRAIMSHYSAYASGERIDPDMGSSHLANLICSALFLMFHDDRDGLTL